MPSPAKPGTGLMIHDRGRPSPRIPRVWRAALTATVVLLVQGCASAAPEVASPAATVGPSAPVAPAVPDAAVEAPGALRGAATHDPRMLGSDTAQVTIIEFTDLQCPYCARFALTTWPALRARYVDTGKVRFASRDLPLPFHAQAVPAAVAARCAGEQGRFFDYREALFGAQSRLGASPYDEIAGRLGLDLGRFATCRGNRAVAAAVKEDARLAAANGITATPTFVIGREVGGEFEGEVLEGARSFEEFSARIEALLQ